MKGSNRKSPTVRSEGFSHGGKVGREGSDTVIAASRLLPTSRMNGAQVTPQQSLILSRSLNLFSCSWVVTQPVDVGVVGDADELAISLAVDFRFKPGKLVGGCHLTDGAMQADMVIIPNEPFHFALGFLNRFGATWTDTLSFQGAGKTFQPQAFGRQFGSRRPVLHVVDDRITSIMGDPASGHRSPLSSWALTFSCISSEMTSFLSCSFSFKRAIWRSWACSSFA